jgi:hypothetical protein
MNSLSPFHHQTNDLTERMNAVIKQYLRYYTNFKGTDLYNFFYLEEFSYSDTVQDSKNFSSFYGNYGFNPRHSPVIPNNTDIPRTHEFTQDYAKNNNSTYRKFTTSYKEAKGNSSTDIELSILISNQMIKYG